MIEGFSEHIVFVDESGDHSLESIDPQYPMFVLAFCVFRKEDYALQVCPSVIQFKCKHFGHDCIVLHEREIRKTQGAFRFLLDPARRVPFYDDLNTLVEEAPFTIIATAIRKDRLVDRYSSPYNPYHLALGFGLERLRHCLRWTAGEAITHVVAECRGAKEDAELELEFRRVCDGDNALNQRLPFEIVFLNKKGNSSGLQLADLVAHPIGRKLLKPAQPNRAYDILGAKLRKNPWTGQTEGWGLKVFP